MKGGIVATIRVNPRDCQSVLDVLEKAGIPTKGMSFAAMTALAFQSLMEAARQSQAIPEPDEFQFLPRLQPYLRAKHGRKLEITKTVMGLGANLRPAPIAASGPEPVGEKAAGSGVSVENLPAAARAPSASPDDAEALRFASRRLTELLAKKDAIEDGADMIWQRSDEEEFQRCYSIVYPEG